MKAPETITFERSPTRGVFKINDHTVGVEGVRFSNLEMRTIARGVAEMLGGCGWVIASWSAEWDKQYVAVGDEGIFMSIDRNSALEFSRRDQAERLRAVLPGSDKSWTEESDR